MIMRTGWMLTRTTGRGSMNGLLVMPRLYWPQPVLRPAISKLNVVLLRLKFSQRLRCDLRQVMPPAAPAGIILYKDVQVQIQVNIDERGCVIAARPRASVEKVNQAVLGVALDAARQWQFQPATLHGQAVGSEYTLVFQFHPRQY